MRPENSNLGKKTSYIEHYDPSLLFPILRQYKRNEIGVVDQVPFHGFDIWNAYEISWLNQKGKPVVAIAKITIPASSPYLIESKSLKLYFNSFNQSKFSHLSVVENIIAADLSSALKSQVTIDLSPLDQMNDHQNIQNLEGKCLDHLDITIDDYQVNSPHLTTENKHTSETIHSHLLKSNCLVTGQPDWGSISISYSGNQINHENLLKYIIGFRQYNEFHEQCVERIFMDILRSCQPESLTVYARYTRRGGIDINPYRTTDASANPKNIRLVRQ